MSLSIDIQLLLFDSLIIPIATYGCEVWGFKHIEGLEKLHLQYCKMILKVNKCTTTAMVLGELGRLPIEYNIRCRMLGFWYKLVCDNHRKFSATLYQLLLGLHRSNVFTCEWLKCIENTLMDCGMQEIWLDQQQLHKTSYNMFKKQYKFKLKEVYIGKWKKLLEGSSKCSLYRNFKTELCSEKYLCKLSEPFSRYICNFRVSNHKLPIEVGRHRKIERIKRICPFCDNKDIGDEYHYICICEQFKSARKALLPKKYITNPSVAKFCQLMKLKGIKTLKKIAILIKIIFDSFK